MLAIVISVCLISNPAICRNERIPLLIHSSLTQCAMNAVPYVAQWNGEHPDWRVVRWRCSGADEKDI
ncbi:hypothetical protein ABLE91_17600 [Aquabacter sp. CN5-332]|uniref:hypothetical protein n=1 Tax=Aquabacter sp. CN5-332 TaxID=3156608 RepID=UPI0032B37D15